MREDRGYDSRLNGCTTPGPVAVAAPAAKWARDMGMGNGIGAAFNKLVCRKEENEGLQVGNYQTTAF